MIGQLISINLQLVCISVELSGDWCVVVGHYSDIHSVIAGRIGGRRNTSSIISDNGHYSDIHGIPAGRDSGHYNILDTDQENDESGDGGEDQRAARSRGYEGLDPSVLATLRQPQRPHDYAGLGAGGNAASTQQTTEQIEMNVIDDDDDYQDAVRRQL